DRCQGGGPGGQGPPIQSFGGGDTFARLVTSAGATLCNLGPQETASPPQWPSTAGLDVGDDSARYDTVSSQDGGTRFRVRTELEPGGGAVLQSAASLSDADATLRRLLVVELLVTASVLLGIVALGVWVVRIGLRPLGAIETTAAAIAAGDLSRRVERADPDTEVGRLGTALNTMLGQIQAAFDATAASEARLRRFAADASHELRTPLAAVRAYAELFGRGASTRP